MRANKSKTELIAQAATTIAAAGETKSYTFMNGVTVEYFPMSAFHQSALGTLAYKILVDQKPQAPAYLNEISGKQELNTNDPVYQSAVIQFNAQWSMQKCGMIIGSSLHADRAAMQAALDALPPIAEGERALVDAMIIEMGLTPAEARTGSIDVMMTLPAWKLLAVRYAAAVCCEYNSVEFVNFCLAIQGADVMEAAVQSAAETFSGDVPE